MIHQKPLSTKERETKLRSYEEYANETLKTGLENIIKQQAQVSNDITEYSNLKKALKLTKNSTKIKTKVDLGFHFFVNAEAEISENNKFMIYLGHDFYAEMDIDQAVEFIDKKVKILEKKLEYLRGEAAQFQGQIRFTLEAVRELTEEDGLKRVS